MRTDPIRHLSPRTADRAESQHLSPGTTDRAESQHLSPGTARRAESQHLSPGTADRAESQHLPPRTGPLSFGTAARLAALAALLPTLALAAPVPSAAPAPAPAGPESTAPAEGPRAQLRVLLLPRREGDPLPPATDNSLRDSLRDGLRRAGAALIEAAPIGAGECGDRACLARLRATIGLRYVVRATLAVVDRDYSLHLELLDTRSGESVNEFREHCPLCGLAEARARVADGAAALLAPILEKPAPPATLTVRSEPPGASIELDGLPVGRAPLERVTTPGPHHLRATLPGHVASERDLTLTDGEQSTQLLTLVREPPPPPRGRVLLALGVPLAVLGVALLTLDDRKLPLGCADGDCQRTMQVMWPGALSLATGAVLTTLGAARMHRFRRARARSAAVAR